MSGGLPESADPQNLATNDRQPQTIQRSSGHGQIYTGEGLGRHSAQEHPEGRRRNARTTSSLENLLSRTALHANDDKDNLHGSEIPLPESRASSTPPTQRQLGEESLLPVTQDGRSSLEMLARLGSEHTTAPLVAPESIPLPPSRSASLNAVPFTNIPPALGYGIGNFHYDNIINDASILPHLNKKRGHIHNQSRQEATNITCIDKHEGELVFRLNYTSTLKSSFFTRLQTFPDTLKQRIIIVEDLSTSAIHQLGNSFGVTPEFFEEHLINSGYSGAQHNDRPSSSWRTSEFRKSYASIKWYRPVIRLATPPYTNTDLVELLKPEGQVEDVSPRSGHLRIFKTETNIFRAEREWQFWTDPRTTTQENRLCGWEERVSVWSRILLGTGCHIVILLVDPLPFVEEGKEESDTVERTQQDSNIPGVRTGNSDISNRDSEYTILDRDRPNVGVDEPRTIDPEAATKRIRTAKRIRRQNTEPTTWNTFLQTFGFRSKVEKPAIKYTKIRSRPIFQQKGHRGRIDDFDFDDVFRSRELVHDLKSSLYHTVSTRDAFLGWFIRDPTASNGSSLGEVSPFLPIFEIIRQDSINILKTLREKLDQMNILILDETKIEDRLLLWRRLITSAQHELHDLQLSMKQFFTFCNVFDDNTRAEGSFQSLNPNQQNGVNLKDTHEFQDLCSQFDEMQVNLQAASKLLTSNMALLDSRRSIAEAHAVSKLTELAFFFIPLTFAASLFSMQIEQFENPAPLSTFVILAVGFTGFSYLVRLTIRSKWLQGLLLWYKRSVGEYALERRLAVRKDHVPATVFLRWTWKQFVWLVTEICTRGWSAIATGTRKFWKTMEFIIVATFLVSIIVVGPLVLLWTRPLAQGTQTIITILVVLVVTPLVVVPYWQYSEPRVRSAFPNLIKRIFTPAKSRTQTLGDIISRRIIWTIFIASGALPIAIVWTRQLSWGIKVAITVAFVLAFLTALALLGIYRLALTALGEDGSDSEDSDLEGVDVEESRLFFENL